MGTDFAHYKYLLFADDFCHAIQRIPHSREPGTLVADITLFVQEGQTRDNFGCQMEIGIVKEKILYYARRLCGVEVEVKDGVRYIRYPNGSKIEPEPRRLSFELANGTRFRCCSAMR
jgi:hypothetical protein